MEVRGWFGGRRLSDLSPGASQAALEPLVAK